MSLASKQSAPRQVSRRSGVYRLGSAVVIVFTVVCIAAFIGLMLRPNVDTGIRIWLLNHAPDQVVIISPFDGRPVRRSGSVAAVLPGAASKKSHRLRSRHGVSRFTMLFPRPRPTRK